MSVARTRANGVPNALSTPMLVDPATSLPRFWPNVWALLDGAHLKENSLRARLPAIDALYRHADLQNPRQNLDALIARGAVEEITRLATGFFMAERNRAAADGRDANARWRAAYGFLTTTLDRVIGGECDDRRLIAMKAALLRLDRQLRNLIPAPVRKRPEALRALPALVVDELYDLVAPDSVRNPFRLDRLRWRNFCLVLVMLHQGLRTGEALLLPVGAIKVGRHPETGQTVRWLNVDPRFADDDPRRSDAPSIKTASSIRQIPVAPPIADAIHTYEANFRGRQSHGFLFVNPQGGPVGTRGVRAMFTALSEKLSPEARAALIDNMRDPVIQAHDLRHTCAVIRLTHFRDAGVDDADALQKLRAFFGWSRTSDMPRHYARAYYENRLATVWRDDFDAHVEILRRLRPGADGIGDGQ